MKKYKRYFQVEDKVVMLSSQWPFSPKEAMDDLRERYPTESIKRLTKVQVDEIKRQQLNIQV